MKRRSVMRWYQGAARVWVTLAAASAFLPVATRVGWWVPLHLLAVGGVSVAISGAEQMFVAALTATPGAPGWLVTAQFVALNAGAMLLVAGEMLERTVLLALGGCAFLMGIFILGGIVVIARRRSLVQRHRLPVAMYLAGLACVAIGATFGILIATGEVSDPAAWANLRSAHMVLNVLGFVTLTILATLITFLPTVLRVRMPAWRGTLAASLLVSGVGVTAAGLALGNTAVAAVGSVVFVAGMVGFGSMVARVLAVPRKWAIPTAGRHLICGMAWLAGGSVWFAIECIWGVDVVATDVQRFVAVFACGWVLQILLGAWLFLLPMNRPAHPDVRRGYLAAMQWLGVVEVAAFNLGWLSIALAGVSGPGDPVLSQIGTLLAEVGVGLALAKAWFYPTMAKFTFFTRGGAAVWAPVIDPPDRPGLAT